MTSHISFVGKFEVDTEDFEAYIERYEKFLLFNDITDDGKKKAIFLASLRKKQANPENKSYTHLNKLLDDQLQPKPNVITTR